MSDLALFQPFPKIPRLRRGCIITEKIDGTNAQVSIEEGLSLDEDPSIIASPFTMHPITVYTVRAGSRTRWLQPGKKTDNYGFAAWVKDNAQLLVETLGVGRHFGEWWGQGIQRGYGMDHKRFSLFNTSRWMESVITQAPEITNAQVSGLAIGVVPILYQGDFSEEAIDLCLGGLETSGSFANSRFDKPEGVVVRLNSSGHTYKVLLENDDVPKGAVA